MIPLEVEQRSVAVQAKALLREVVEWADVLVVVCLEVLQTQFLGSGEAVLCLLGKVGLARFDEVVVDVPVVLLGFLVALLLSGLGV